MPGPNGKTLAKSVGEFVTSHAMGSLCAPEFTGACARDEHVLEFSSRTGPEQRTKLNLSGMSDFESNHISKNG